MSDQLLIGHNREHVLIDWNRHPSNQCKLTVEEARHVAETIVKYADDLEGGGGLHECCWHADGMVQTTSPPRYPETCCHCGEKRIVRKLSSSNIEGSHGPHFVERFQLNIVHPKPSPENYAMSELINRDIKRAGGGPVDSVYGFRFTSREDATHAADLIELTYPDASCEIEEIPHAD